MKCIYELALSPLLRLTCSHAKNFFMEQISAIIFDLDDTLYPYDPCHDAALDAVSELGVSAKLAKSSDEFRVLYAQARSEVKTHIGDVAASHHRLFYFQRLVERSFKRVSPPLVLKLYQTYWDVFIKTMKLDEGGEALLADLHGRQIPIANISDVSADIQHRKLIHLGVDEYFSSVITSEEAGVEKPNPKLVQLALDRLGVPRSRSVVLIGDSPNRDLAMAERAGLTSIWRKRGRAALPIGITADHTVSSMAELGELLGAKNLRVH